MHSRENSIKKLLTKLLGRRGLAPTLLLLTLATTRTGTLSASPTTTSPTASAAATPSTASTTATRATTPATTPTAATTSIAAPSTTPAATSTTAAAASTTPATLALAAAALRTSRSSPNVLRDRDVSSSSRGVGGGKGGGGTPLKEGTSGMGLVLGGQGSVVLTGHSDASWADDQATQRSSQGYTFSLGSESVSWRSTRSSSVLSSSCEAEIYAGAMAAQELRWLTYLLTDLGERPRSPLVLYVDNKAMLALCHEQRLEHITKHIALRYFLARELQQRRQLRLSYVTSRANIADVLTKALGSGPTDRFAILCPKRPCIVRPSRTVSRCPAATRLACPSALPYCHARPCCPRAAPNPCAPAACEQPLPRSPLLPVSSPCPERPCCPRAAPALRAPSAREQLLPQRASSAGLRLQGSRPTAVRASHPAAARTSLPAAPRVAPCCPVRRALLQPACRALLPCTRCPGRAAPPSPSRPHATNAAGAAGSAGGAAGAEVLEVRLGVLEVLEVLDLLLTVTACHGHYHDSCIG
ncbi:unnamed protein product [Closterium sp. NIES-54]